MTVYQDLEYSNPSSELELPNRRVSRSACSVRYVVLAGLLGIFVGYLGSQVASSSKLQSSQLFNRQISLPVVPTVFTYNKTFGANPFEGTATQEAWDSIVPAGQGTVEFPKDSRQFATLSAVHQLHCLWSIHQTLFTALSNSSTSESEGGGGEHSDHQDGKSVADQRLPHVRHCFDYLRQTLMCASDTTLEPIDLKLGGVTGWGAAKTCRSYDYLKQWAEDHRANDLHGFREGHHEH